MSSDERSTYRPKHNRTIGACDFCKKRKIKCDSETVDDQCTPCQRNGTQCTHTGLEKKRAGVRPYVRVSSRLEKRIKELELELAEARKISGPACRNDESNRPILQTLDIGMESSHNVYDVPEPDAEYLELFNHTGRKGHNHRYFGPTSNLYFMRKMLKSTFSTNECPAATNQPSSSTMPPWETEPPEPPRLLFPEDDLLEHLVHTFFNLQPRCLPFLHEESFRRDVSSGLHFLDSSFGALVLLVCAVASKVSTDPRVFLSNEPGDSEYSAGWKYFSQTTALPKSLLHCPTLYDVQFCCMYVEYIMGTSAPQSAWTVVGLGLRYCIELGYHRQRPGEKPSVEREMQKLSFWSLLSFDRLLSLYNGRPPFMREDDYDVELPLECDPEYYETGNPENNFKQPPGRPAAMASTIHVFRLVKIASFAMNKLYPTRKPKQPQSSDDDYMAVVDSMLNSWFNDIPSQLQWVSDTPSDAFFADAAVAHMMYYSIQILIHRPFIYKSGASNLPSLAICTNAARCTSKIADALTRKYGRMALFIVHISTFLAGIILAMNIRRRRQVTTSPAAWQDMESLYRCLGVLTASQKRFSVCRRLIQTLQSLVDIPVEDLSQPAGNARNPWDTAASSGYALQQRRPDICELDPTLFGLMPPPANDEGPGNIYPQADLTLLMDEDATMWLERVQDAAPHAVSPGQDWGMFLTDFAAASATYF